MPRALPLSALLTLALLTAVACTAPPAGPPLLPPDRIAQATLGTTAPPDIGPLAARATRLGARAALLRRITLDGFDALPPAARARLQALR